MNFLKESESEESKSELLNLQELLESCWDNGLSSMQFMDIYDKIFKLCFIENYDKKIYDIALKVLHNHINDDENTFLSKSKNLQGMCGYIDRNYVSRNNLKTIYNVAEELKESKLKTIKIKN